MYTKTITVSEFSAKAHTLVGDVLEGDVIRVDCGESGAFVLVDETEYLIKREALAAIIYLGSHGKLPGELQKFID